MSALGITIITTISGSVTISYDGLLRLISVSESREWVPRRPVLTTSVVVGGRGLLHGHTDIPESIVSHLLLAHIGCQAAASAPVWNSGRHHWLWLHACSVDHFPMRCSQESNDDSSEQRDGSMSRCKRFNSTQLRLFHSELVH